jgi:dolichyl-phosphate-mannose-protein mannosyltransferase
MKKFDIKKYWKKLKLNNSQLVLILILLFAFCSKAWQLAHPDEYYFDEIYAGYTAEQYALDNNEAWVWDFHADEGFAFNWDHPPLGRIIMSLPVRILGVSSLSRRIMPMMAGVLLSLVVYKIAQLLFPKREFIWITSALFVAMDGLVLSLSRIALVDTLLTLFITTSIYFLLAKKYFWSSIFWGAAAACKWTGVFLLTYVFIILLMQQKWKKKLVITNLLKVLKTGALFVTTGVLVYLLSYTAVIYHYGFKKVIHLHQQMFWYHSQLVATHPSQSSALSWPLNIKPVWFWVDYGDKLTGNIYALGNPLIFWTGLLAICFTLLLAIKSRDKRLWYLLLAYPVCWIQWIKSPRIMFLYHYLPAIPFLCIMLAVVLATILKFDKKLRWFVYFFVFSVMVTFIHFYPFWTGIPITNEKVKQLRWLSSWK